MTKPKFIRILGLGFHLTFACLREAASAKAGILKFGFYLPWIIS
jgi:hypothetical protein